jgi:hypothetical protein
MPRHALASFFERLVVATLPLAVCACGGTRPTRTPDMTITTTADMSADMSAADAVGDMAVTRGAAVDMPGAPADLVGAPDLVGVPDPCDHLPPGGEAPPVVVGFPSGDVPDGGFKTPCQTGAICIAHCPSYYYRTCCGPDPADGGALVLNCIASCTGPGPGRRPPGLQSTSIAARCQVGQWLANAAHLEAASVHAFRVLGRELGRHGAPRGLVAGARRALRDEARHARMTARLARAHGVTPPPVRVARAHRRSLEEIAVENAAEGCVRETFAAMLAMWQARAAADPEVRQTMAAIALDEVRHAELAWSVDAWARRHLDSAARRRVDQARSQAVTELSVAVSNPPAALVRAIGLPDGARARTLVAALERELWSRS